VAAHGATVLRVCRAVVGPVDAEDAWSETFLSALRAYPDLRPDSDVRAWLVTIAHRKAIDVTRATARRPIPGDGRLPEPATDGPPSAVDADADLWAALADLPPRQRQAVAYHHDPTRLPQSGFDVLAAVYVAIQLPLTIYILESFFARIPEADRTFLKEAVDDPSIVAAWSLRYCRVSSTCTLARSPKRSRRYRRMSSPRGVASRRSGMCS